LDQNSLEFGGGLIDQKVHSRGDKHQISVDGRHVCAPGANIAPSHHIREGLFEYGIAGADFDFEAVPGGEGKAGSDCAGDGGC